MKCIYHEKDIRLVRYSLASTVMRVLIKTVVMMMMTDYDGRDR
jgi:hypothetical protein